MVQILGYCHVNYTSKTDGTAKDGYRWYLSDDSDSRVVGLITYDLFTSSDIGNEFFSTVDSVDDVVGAYVNIAYNRFGRVQSISLA